MLAQDLIDTDSPPLGLNKRLASLDYTQPECASLMGIGLTDRFGMVQRRSDSPQGLIIQWIERIVLAITIPYVIARNIVRQVSGSHQHLRLSRTQNDSSGLPSTW